MSQDEAPGLTPPPPPSPRPRSAVVVGLTEVATDVREATWPRLALIATTVLDLVLLMTLAVFQSLLNEQLVRIAPTSLNDHEITIIRWMCTIATLVTIGSILARDVYVAILRLWGRSDRSS